MKSKYLQFIIRPRIFCTGLFFLLLSLFGLFHQKTVQIEVQNQQFSHQRDMNIHEVIVNIPIDTKPLTKSVCNIQIESGNWNIIILTHPDKLNELRILGNGKTILSHKLQGTDMGHFSLLTMSLYDGMIIIDGKNGSTPLPSKNFSLKKLTGINGLCSIQYTGSYRKITMFSFVLLGIAVFLSIIAIIPKFPDKCRLNKKLLQIGTGCLAGEILASGISFFHIICNRNFYPYNTFLFRPETIAGDIFQTLLPVRHVFLPYGWIEAGNYFPFTYNLLSVMPTYNLQAFAALFYALFAIVSAVSALKTVRPRNRFECFLVLFLTWGTLPALLLWTSGNLEMLIFVIITGFLFFLRRCPGISAFLLAVAINIKLYPGVLGVVFLKKKAYKQTFLCMIFSLILLSVSLASQDWNIEKPLKCFKHFADIYTVFINDGLIFSHSLFSIYRYIGCHFFGLTANGIKAAMPCYSIFCLLFFAVIVWNILKHNFSSWETLFLLIGAAILFPPVSFDYTLILLLPALWLFIKHRKKCRFDKLYTICWILILIPENWHHSPLWAELQISVLIKPAVILLMMTTILLDAQARNSGIKALKNPPDKVSDKI